MATAGYSGKPLAEKLGIKAGHILALLGEPDGFREWLAPLPDGVRTRKSIGRSPDVVVIFAKRRFALSRRVARAAEAIFPDGSIWVGWPKQSSNVPSDVTGGVVREIALPLGLVDTKVCAISEVWSGLRIVWRKELRKGIGPGDGPPSAGPTG